MNYGKVTTIIGKPTGGFRGIGGIGSYINATSVDIKNAFNVGELFTEGDNIGGIMGRQQDVADKEIVFLNCYYKNDVIKKGVGSGTESINIIGKNEQYLKSEDFVKNLNNTIEKGIIIDQVTNEEIKIDTTGWAKWIYKNGSYPELDFTTKWDGTEWIKQSI